MPEQIRQIMRIAVSLPVRVGIGAILLIFIIAATQTYFYSFDRPQVIVALLLSVILLGHSAFVIIRSVVKRPPSQHGVEMPTPADDKEIQHQHLKLQGQMFHDMSNDG